ncbi:MULTISPECIES: hypothetical protein [Cyanophyceae]|uniref:hypothetical protein n=1 Tax=Cyanophyceae TaxID=3028117 RepID=UPI00168821CE|nr:hypothetical protein [Trichocoleus sp. FACHB-69]MBD1934132.1 hypothetical protein [Trichocoleus sp. FACHB-69]
MAEIQDTHPHNNLPNGETTSQEPLGFKNPLLPANPLGQNFISRKFLYPLGARAITAFDPSVFFSREMPDEVPPDNPFDNSPFFAESQASQLSKSVAASDGITSAAAPPVVAQLKESTLIQPRLETEKPASRAEVIKPVTTPQVTYKINQGKEDNSGLLSSTTTLSEMLPATITEVTQIQPRLESQISTYNSEVSQSITAPQVASITQEKQEFDPATTQQVRIIDGTQIQPRLENQISTDNPEVSQSITAPQVGSIAEEKQELDPAIVPQITTTEATQIQPRLESKTPNTTEAIESGITRQETLAVPKAAEEITDSQSEFVALDSVTKSEETPQVTTTDATQIQPRLESEISADNPEVAQSITALEVASITQEKQGFDPATTPPATTTDATIVQAFKESKPQPGNREVIEPITLPELSSITQEKQEFDPTTTTPQVTITDAAQIQPRLESQISTENSEVIQSITAPQVNSGITQEKEAFAPTISPEVTITDATIVQAFKESKTEPDNFEEIDTGSALEVIEKTTQEEEKFATLPSSTTLSETPEVTITDATIQPRLEEQTQFIKTEGLESLTVTSLQVAAEVTQEEVKFAPRTTPQVTITGATQIQPRLESQISTDNTEKIELVAVPQVADEVTQEKEDFAPAITPQVTITDATQVQTFKETERPTIKTEGIESVAAPQVADEVTQEKEDFAPATTPQVTFADAIEGQISAENTEEIESLTVTSPQIAEGVTQEKEEFAPATTPEVTITDATVQPRLESKISDENAEQVESGTAPEVNYLTTQPKEEFAPATTPEVTITDATVQPRLESKISVENTEGIESIAAPELADEVTQQKVEFVPAKTPEVTIADVAQVQAFKETPTTKAGGIESVIALKVASEATQEKEAFASVTTPEVTIGDTTGQPRLESKILTTKTEGIEPGTSPQVASKVNEAQSELGALASVTMPEETPQVTTTNSIQVQAQLETQTPATTEGIERETTPDAAPLPLQPAAEQTSEVAVLSNVTEPMPFSVSRKVESVEMPAIASEKTLTQSDITAPSLASSVTTPDVPLVQLLSEQEPRKATEEAVSEINAPSSVVPIPTQLHENSDLRVEEAIAPISSDTSNKQVSKITTNTEMGVVQPLLDNQLSAQSQVPTAREDLADKVEEAAPISSATDNKQVSESTPNTQANIVQPLGEIEPRQQIEEIPQLPTVLTNLSILSPLTQSNLLVSKFPEQTTLNVEESLLSPSKLPGRIQRMPEEGDKGQEFGDSEVKPTIQRSVSSSFEEKLRSQQAGDLPESNQSSIPLAKDSAIAKTIPTSWSSIADLIGEATSDSSNSMIVQPLLEERGWQEPIISSSDSRNSYSTVDSPHTDRANGVIQAYSNTSGRTSASGMEALRQLMESSGGSKVEAHQSDEDFSEDEGVDNLEILAREIYSFIKQRLEIERERRGNNYSGRLPW